MLTIAARKSHLARLQALTVGNALQEKHPNLQIKYHFRESLGDKNQTDPLWKMPEKGVFTEDFIEGLKTGEFDLVVHSWKDLPMDERPGLEICATLPRADARDLLLIKKSFFDKRVNSQLRIFSSSPRRTLNIGRFIKKVWPYPLDEVQFLPVRGNMTTRLRKMHETKDVDGLVVAKAAFDRMMKASEFLFNSENKFQIQEQNLEWINLKEEILPQVQSCRWMILPLSENPTAAAQGALAIEVRSDRDELKKLLAPIHCLTTFENVMWEREILKSYGGGCHQAIGVSVVTSESIAMIRGLTTQGEELAERRYKIKKNFQMNSQLKINKNKVALYFIPNTDNFFERVEIAQDIQHRQINYGNVNSAEALFISRANAVSKNFKLNSKQILWTAGVKTWIKLAQQGYWINGCSDSLGFEEPELSAVGIFKPLNWVRLTHDQVADQTQNIYATYHLVPRERATIDWQDAQFYYWKSGVLFEKALEYFPNLLEKKHACGFGDTAKVLKKYFTPNKNLFYFFDEEDFLNFIKEL